MCSILLSTHSLFRWLVLVFILSSIYRAFVGYAKNKAFSKMDNSFRHWTATLAHIQLTIGMIILTQSALAKFFWSDTKTATQNLEITFYGLIHPFCMLTAVTLLTIGSAVAKRKATDKEKFKTMLIWFSVALLIIFMAIPWPFSPLSSRPYYRTF